MKSEVASFPVVGPRLRILLRVVLVGFGLLCMNTAYLLTVSGLEWMTGESHQGLFYLWMFLVHLALGLALVVPALTFAALHVRNAYFRPNRRAVRAGIALFGAMLMVLVSGLFLARYGFFEFRSSTVRIAAYWAHVTSPLFVVWLFILHRLAGPRVRWRLGLSWIVATAVCAAVAVAWSFLAIRSPWALQPVSEQPVNYFAPSLAQTATGRRLPAQLFMLDSYCQECHPDIHASWAVSAHRFSSFNNPAYLLSIRETRQVLLARDGNSHAARFCAACHDPVPLFSGDFDDPNFEVEHPTAQAGITCSVCHAVSAIASPRGNGAYIIEAPIHYPFTFSENRFLRMLGRQLVKAKPDFHKRTFLKPLHRTAEFCGTCHKVHLPEALNRYRWLRGQNHYDAFLLSGVSGHGVSSFYYPPQAMPNCNECHMPLLASNDFGAQFFQRIGTLAVHSHLFPAANTALPHLLDLPASVVETQRAFLKDSLRVDIFAIREGGTIDGQLYAPIRPDVPALHPGKTYLIEVVLRTLRVGHTFTQGTADSNEVWVDVTVTTGGRVIGRSGALARDGTVDPWSHFVNAYMLDRQGRRIDRRNVQDIFVPLYDHQIPPGAADVVHYRLPVPEDASEPIVVEIKLRYRKFDTTFMRHILGARFVRNDLPMTTIASDRVVFSLVGGVSLPPPTDSPVPLWERWNDYGIGLLRKSGAGSNRGELRQAAVAFTEVERLGRPDGPLNLARVFLQEGHLAEAAAALRRAVAHTPPAPAWVVTWLTGLVNQQTGHLDAAIANFRSLVEMDTAETRRRGFNFARDYRLLNELGKSVFERAKQERRDQTRRHRLLQEAAQWFKRSLTIDPENVTAHYNLALLAAQLGTPDKAATHSRLHNQYRPDENARDRAVAIARSTNPAADRAAEAIVIYDLQPEGSNE